MPKIGEDIAKMLSSHDGGLNMQGDLPGRARRRAYGPSLRHKLSMRPWLRHCAFFVRMIGPEIPNAAPQPSW